MIPGILRRNFKINNNAIFIGMLSRFEIWSENSWNKNLKRSFDKFQNSREVLDGI